MSRIKIGQIGLGHNHGAGKMQAVRKFPDLFEVIGYAEENPEWVEKRGGVATYAGLDRFSVDELLDKCDAILVETDVWDLTRTAQRCIAAGKHIHMDKPAGGTLAEYKKLLDDAKKDNLVVQLGYMYRYNPAVKKCLEMVQAGELGDIFSINAEMSTGHTAVYREWLKHFRGGTMYIFGCHLIDLIVYLLGEPQRVISCLKHSGKDGVDVADTDFALLEYERALARVFVSSVELNGYGRRQFVVSGSKGTVNICPLENPVTMTWTNEEIAKPFQDQKIILPFEDKTAGGRYDEMMQDFYSYIKKEKANHFTYEHEYTVQKILLEIIGGDL